VLPLSAPDHEGRRSKSVNLPSSFQSIQTTSERIAAQPLGRNLSILSDQLTLHAQHASNLLSYLVKKTGRVTEKLLKDWSVHKTIILGAIFIVSYQLCTTLIHALQVDNVTIV
jgi:hypothetical protein